MAILSVWLASFRGVSGSHQNWDSVGDEGNRSSLKQNKVDTCAHTGFIFGCRELMDPVENPLI